MAFKVFGMDFETYSEVDITKRGLRNYVSHSSFRPLLFSWYGVPCGENTIDFEHNDDALESFQQWMSVRVANNDVLVAHNAGFERSVLRQMGVPHPFIVDSAVIARAYGADGSLRNASRQLLDMLKLDEGYELIKLFSMPSEANMKGRAVKPCYKGNYPSNWSRFVEYCERDAKLSYLLYQQYSGRVSGLEDQYLTDVMNDRGWPVDLHWVYTFQHVYEKNISDLMEEWERYFGDLNPNSPKQLAEWFEARSLKMSGFDKGKVAAAIKRFEKRLETETDDAKHIRLVEAVQLLTYKQALGGTALKKLDKIVELTDGRTSRLYDEYVHVGASTTLRTTSKGVQLQNLRRLRDDEPADLDEHVQEMDNDELAYHMRQLFKSTDGVILVGDFAQIEARCLPWLAGQEETLNAFRSGQDLYKATAANLFGMPYDIVDKHYRQLGKAAVLGCGYGGGPVPVQSRAKSAYGLDLDDTTVKDLVSRWRASHGKITNLWAMLDNSLKSTLMGLAKSISLPYGATVEFKQVNTPESLQKQHPGCQSIAMRVFCQNESTHPQAQNIDYTLYFHGVYRLGKDICFYKPSQNKTGDPWSKTGLDPDTKQRYNYNLHGGKLAGILTQSFCRAMFFQAATAVYDLEKDVPGLRLIGQFHDEVDCEYTGDDPWTARQSVKTAMVNVVKLNGFPIDADVAYSERYIK